MVTPFTTISSKIYIVAAMACLFLSACSEQKSEYFNNGIEARGSAAARGGWLPVWFPAEAKEIHLQYDLDTNYRWFRFKLDKASRTTFLRYFHQLSWDEAKNIAVSAPRHAEWWFEGLIQTQSSSDAALNAELYLRKDNAKISEKVFLAVSNIDDAIYLWIER